MAENLMKVPAKGILKNSTSFEGSTTNKGSSNRGTKWDEMNILATHHPPDKDYGHMKIEEPKTPFSYHGEDSGDEEANHDLDSKLLTERLMADAEKLPIQQAEALASDDEEDDEEVEGPEDKVKRKSFEHKRKAHYNEFMAVKLARQLMQKEEDDVENTEEGKCEEGDSLVEEEEIEQDDIEGEKMDTVDSTSEFQLNASKPH